MENLDDMSSSNANTKNEIEIVTVSCVWWDSHSQIID